VRQVGEGSLTAVLLTALVSRLLLAAAAFAAARDPATFATGDSPRYLQLATSLVRDGRFWTADGPELFREPGYPLLLAFGIAVGHPTLFAILAQAVFGCLTTYFVWRTAVLVLPAQVAFVCALACAIEPSLVLWSVKIAPEALFTMFIAMAAWGLTYYLRTDAIGWLLVSAVAVVGATYTRPVSYFLPLWLAAVLLMVLRSRPWAYRLIPIAAFLTTCALLLGAWQVRNAVVGGYYGFSTQIDDVIGRAAPAAVASAETGRRFSDADYFERPGPDGQQTPAHMRNAGFKAVLRAPATFAWLYSRAIFRTVFHPGAVPYLELFGYQAGALEQEVFDRGSIAGLIAAYRGYRAVFWATVVLMAALLPYLLLPAIVMIRPAVPDPRIRWALAAIVIYFVLISGVPTSQSRFREPMMPILAVLAGYVIYL
jgi:4-amino-4-deoxy-L-arabinose transferase-like glycosyltransferase